MALFYKISDIATLMGVTIKTLKYYDSIGILTPEYRDEATGYRYYSDRNINQLSYILVLKRCGFPLKQIAKYFDSSYVPGTLTQMLTTERDMLNRHLEKLQDFHQLPDTAPVKEEFIPESLTLWMHFLAKTVSAIPDSFQTLIQDAVAYRIQLANVYCHICVHDPQKQAPESIYMDSYLEINREHVPKNVPQDRLAVLPAGRFVTSILSGDYSGFDQVYRNMLAYCMEHNLKPTGFPRKYYLRHPKCGITDPSEYVTKIALPVI